MAGSKRGANGVGKGSRARYAREAEETAARNGVMLRRGKAAAARPKRTEIGGATKTRSASADTRPGKTTSDQRTLDGVKKGLGRRHVGSSGRKVRRAAG